MYTTYSYTHTYTYNPITIYIETHLILPPPYDDSFAYEGAYFGGKFLFTKRDGGREGGGGSGGGGEKKRGG
jgi:hypothetical protein